MMKSRRVVTKILGFGVWVAALGVIGSYPGRDRIATARLQNVVSEIRNDPAWKGRTGSFPVRGSVLSWTKDGTAYVLRNDDVGTQIFFSQNSRPSPGDSKKVQADGYLYSIVPISKVGWIDVSNASPPLEEIGTWGGLPIRPHWYDVEPFYSD